ncbi:MAG: serine hydrolase domain-containing protein [Rhizomicrobium sp.]
MRRVWRGGILLALLSCLSSPALAGALAARLDGVVQAADGRFSGAILIERDGAIVFDKAYGMANAAAGLANRSSTSFHIGTLSMQYTAVTILHLVETRRLALDNTADQFVPGAPAVTLQALLATAPEAPDAVANYELLARIAAAATGKSFAEVEDAAAFGSVWLTGTGLDDGVPSNESRFAKGYVLADGQLKPVAADWAALTGAASAYTTTRDELHWLDRFFGDELVTADTRKAMTPAGHGWHQGGRFGADSHWAAGTAPGFSSFVLRRPGLTVIVLENIGAAPAEALAGDLIAALDARE